jgi:23S rRNA pseudouridine1911/1915/1917 synthase
MSNTGTTPDIPIVYEDNHLLVIDKPHNILSQGDQTGDPDVLTLCKEYLKKKYNKSGNVYLGLVHRLDRPVGGLMLLAKTSKAAERLSRQLRHRTVQKVYWAVTIGHPPQNGLLTHYLIKDRSTNIVRTVPEGTKGAKDALLSFVRLQQIHDLSLLSVHLQTGRPHQIRVQLAADGYPVWGDQKYGFRQDSNGSNIALRAVELVFQHPVQKKEIRITLPPPPSEPWNKFNIEL